MTDGIIQQAFKKFMQDYHSLDNRSLTELQQELIEKINILHEESLDVSETYSLGHMHFYHKLIGDNQE